MKWIYHKNFNHFKPDQLYRVLKLRQDIFIIEQDCIYPDLDLLDQKSEHLLCLEDDELIGYLRIVPKGLKFPEVSIGRIIVSQSHRNRGVGKILVQKGIDQVLSDGDQTIRIEAQAHLEKFYTDLRFSKTSKPYDVDGIPHIEMVYGG